MEKLMKPDEVAELLGVSRKTVYNYIRNAKINLPVFRPTLTSPVRFRREAVEAYIRDNEEKNEKIFRPRV